MIGQDIRNALAPALFIVAVVGVLAVARLGCGCTPAEQNAAGLSVENALAVKQYDEALEECFQAARRKPEALRFEAFKDCELATIKEFCASSESLRKHWPRCGGE